MVQAVLQRDARDSDAEIRHVGEVGQPGAARLVGLAEDDVLLGPVHGAPSPDAALQRAANAGPEFGMAADHLLEDGDRAQPGEACSMGTTTATKTSPSGSGRRRPRRALLAEGSRGALAIRCPVALLIDALAAATATVSV